MVKVFMDCRPVKLHPWVIVKDNLTDTLNVSGWAASVGSVAHKHAMMIVLSGADDKDIQGFKLATTQGTMVYGQDPNTAPVPGLIEKLEQAGCLKGIASAAALGESIWYLNATIGG